MQGAAFGTGSAVAHRTMDAVLGDGGGSQPVPEAAAAPFVESGDCVNQSKVFADCMAANNGELAACQFYFDMLQQCKMNSQL